MERTQHDRGDGFGGSEAGTDHGPYGSRSLGATTDRGTASDQGGLALPSATRGKMEGAFGADFSAVRVHEGPQAAAAGAQAYTQGADIHFAPGAYQPSTSRGDELLGHELTHVVQQRGGAVQAQAKGAPINADPALEAEADTLGAQAAQGHAVDVTGATSAGGMQLKRYLPGQRLPFRYQDHDFEGLVIRVRTDHKDDDSVVYEVDANMDGNQQSLVVSGGNVLSVEAPPMPQIDKEVDKILDMDIRVSKGGDGGEAGDLLIGSGITVKKPVERHDDSKNYGKAKRGFLENVVRDLVIMSMTRSGRSLLSSIEQAFKEHGKRIIISCVDGYLSRSNGGQMGGEGGTWDDGKQRPGDSTHAVVSYNPDMLGLPIAYDHDQGKQVHDETIFPALEDGWGRPKNKPSDVTLFHEMVHGDDIIRGRLYTQEVSSGNFDHSKVSEMHAVGLDEYRDDDFLSGKSENPEIYSENTYRHERGVAQRDWYKDRDETEDAPEKDKHDDGEYDDQPTVKEPKKLGFFNSKKKKKGRKDQIDQVRKDNDQKRQHNQRAQQLRQERNVEENRGALVEETKRTNRQAQEHAKLDELDKQEKKQVEGGEKKLELLEDKDKREDDRDDDKQKQTGKEPKKGNQKKPRWRGNNDEEPVPGDIGGKVVQWVQGSGMNCLIAAILTSVGQYTPKRVLDAREFLIEQGVARSNQMLELAGESGQALIGYLRSQHLVGQGRGVRVHYHMGGDLVHQDVAGGGNPIQVYLSFSERHFYAVLD